ncbi:hypothetical protein TNCV_1806601 [Trichonephila clavipes]|nr:hypothetical protein TNCV_1806601 [Trichonephila clavipes]
MKKEKRNTYRCGQRTVRLAVVACSQKPSSLRAQAQLSETKTETMRTETVETFELVKGEQKLLREKQRRERARSAMSTEFVFMDDNGTSCFEGSNLSQDQLDNLILSMPRCCTDHISSY